MIDERYLKKPKYKVGDVVVYRDRYDREKSTKTVHQSNITLAYALIDIEDKSDELTWIYETEEVRRSEADTILESQILYKL